MIAMCAVMTVNATGWLLPVPADKLGWGLRFRPLEHHQPYLSRESIWSNRAVVVLINQSNSERKYLLLDLANRIDDLEVIIKQPNGKPLRAWHKN